MTYGHWLRRCHDELEAARAGMAETPQLGAADAAALEFGRGRVYRALARTADVLNDCARSASVGRGAVSRRRQDVAAKRDALVSSLHAAAELPSCGDRCGGPASETAHRLMAAAEALGASLDVLASHLGPDGRPLSLEGEAVGRGEGLPGGFSDIAALAIDMLHVDGTMSRWIGRRPVHRPSDRRSYDGVKQQARQVSSGRLRRSARAVIADSAGAECWMRRLRTAVPSADQSVDTDPVRAASAMLASCREWISRHPGEVRLDHLHPACRLAETLLAAHGPCTSPASGAFACWRAAASITAGLQGARPLPDSRDVAHTLLELTGWLQLLPRASHHGRDDHNEHREALGELVDQLPALAEVLIRGLQYAVRRGEIFVTGDGNHGGLDHLLGAASWHVATYGDEPIRGLDAALLAAARGDRTTVGGGDRTEWRATYEFDVLSPGWRPPVPSPVKRGPGPQHRRK
jgi:hypothetical protein